MNTAAAPAPVQNLSFEKALAELEGIVKRLEDGKVDLEESIEIYARGEALKAHCEALLTRAQTRIETIKTGPDGKAIGTEPLDVDN